MVHRDLGVVDMNSIARVIDVVFLIISKLFVNCKSSLRSSVMSLSSNTESNTLGFFFSLFKLGSEFSNVVFMRGNFKPIRSSASTNLIDLIVRAFKPLIKFTNLFFGFKDSFLGLGIINCKVNVVLVQHTDQAHESSSKDKPHDRNDQKDTSVVVRDIRLRIYPNRLHLIGHVSLDLMGDGRDELHLKTITHLVAHLDTYRCGCFSLCDLFHNALEKLVSLIHWLVDGLWISIAFEVVWGLS